jgi:acyl-homoserine lactone acylase PvdQ
VRELLPKFLSGKPETSLANWDGTMSADRAEPLLMAAWWREFARALYADELGDAFRGNWAARAVFLDNVLSRQQHWCDDVRTPAVEGCNEILAVSLEKALADLERRYGRTGNGASRTSPGTATGRSHASPGSRACLTSACRAAGTPTR